MWNTRGQVSLCISFTKPPRCLFTMQEDGPISLAILPGLAARACGVETLVPTRPIRPGDAVVATRQDAAVCVCIADAQWDRSRANVVRQHFRC